jgi:hypothetical protein
MMGMSLIELVIVGLVGILMMVAVATAIVFVIARRER